MDKLSLVHGGHFAPIPRRKDLRTGAGSKREVRSEDR
jgi:hypothetical protein